MTIHHLPLLLCEMTWIEGFPSAIFKAEMEDKTHFNYFNIAK